MYGILSDFIYWLNCNILSVGDDITIPWKPLSQDFLWDLSFLSIAKEWRLFKE